MIIEILCTGDEILTGKTINTNFSHISSRLNELGLTVRWGTTVGDDRDTLMEAFRLAASRADAVIVNGGLGPTVDDLSQEIAAKAAGVELILSEEWLARIESFYARRNRVMPPNNRKQALLPAGAELIDNPIGTACGFAVTIGKARFFFTPGVPREMRRMLDEQLIPRLMTMSGLKGVTRLKRFHSFGIGESRADEVLAGIPGLEDGGSVKLGFQSHYPQLETKLAIRADDEGALARTLGPIEAEVRRRLGNFIIAEDDQRLEGVILDRLAAGGHTLAIAEMVTGGGVAQRIAPQVAAGSVFRRGIVGRDLGQVLGAVGLDPGLAAAGVTEDAAMAVAQGLRQMSGATHGLAVLMELDEGEDRLELGGNIRIGIADPTGALARPARMLGGREWVRMGAIELALDALRRRLLGLRVDERIDFERR